MSSLCYPYYSKPVWKLPFQRLGYLEMRRSKSHDLCDLERINLFDNSVIEQVWLLVVKQTGMCTDRFNYAD